MNKEMRLLDSIPDSPEFDSDSDNVEYEEDQNDQELNFHDTSELFDLNNDYSFNQQDDFSQNENYLHDSFAEKENRNEYSFSSSDKIDNIETLSPRQSVTSSQTGSQTNQCHKRRNAYSPSCADENSTNKQNRKAHLTSEHSHSSKQSVNPTQDSHENNLNDRKVKTCTPLPQHIFETEIADDRHSQYSRDNNLSRDIEFTLIRSSADRDVTETKNRLSSAAHNAFHGPPKRYIYKIKNGQEYYDLNIDMELQKDDRIFLEQQKQNNV
jgi:hypothetical protein